MKAIEISAKLRENVGKKSAKLLRREQAIPCVLYGTEKNIHFSAIESEFRHLIYTPDVHYAKINIDGTEHKAIVKDIQFHPVSDKILHIDFLNIYEDKPITVSIPVKLSGFAKGVQDGGKLYQDARRLQVTGLLKHFIEVIEIDVTELKIASSIRVSDIKLDNLTISEASHKNVASVRVTRAAKEAEAVPGAPAAEGAPAAAAPAAPAKK
ncbi:MAG: 50S ribosomal protein L25/general stress protein Ctc [Bacteroidia bacterium]|nr:50S ribosomal protein L25/general stress protein Ctc [Bacteroidia bacterium]